MLLLAVCSCCMLAQMEPDGMTSESRLWDANAQDGAAAKTGGEHFGAGVFGRWAADGAGLPAYDYELDQTADPRAEYQTTRGASRDHWHLIGNDRIFATAHNGGHVALYDWSRGPRALNRTTPARHQYGGGFKIIRQDGKVWNTRWQDLPAGSSQRRRFGAGYFEKDTLHDGLRVVERISAPSGDDPALLSETILENASATGKEVTVVEYWGCHPLQLLFAPLAAGPFLWMRDAVNLLFRAEARWTPETDCLSVVPSCVLGALAPRADRPAFVDWHPKTLFLAALDSDPRGGRAPIADTRAFFGKDGLESPAGMDGSADRQFFHRCRAGSGRLMLSFRRTLRLAAGETVRLRHLYGYAETDAVPDLVERHRRMEASPGPATVSFAAEGLDWLGREMAWHASSLQAGAVYSDYYGAHVVDQGSAYLHEQGLSGASRDFALFLLPLVYLRPDLAREGLRFMAATQDEKTGAFPYALIGHGRQTGAVIHSKSSDLDLFFFWALAEYLAATRDHALLQETAPYYPAARGARDTLLAHTAAAMRHLEERVGPGPHGLLRCGTGDWNDGLLALSGRPLSSLARGESGFNAGLAAWVLPRLAAELAPLDPELARRMLRMGGQQREALRRLWNGRWMLRGFAGAGERPLGEADRLFLDAQPFAALARAWTPAQRKTLFGNIAGLCVAPQRAGALCIAPVTDNIADPGTTWAAVDAWLAHAWAETDPEAAWRFFLGTTMAARAEAYPGLWYGIWSGPDAYAADSAARPGEAFTGVLTPTCNFPVMNMNRHAGMLYDMVKFAGFRPEGGRIIIDPLLPPRVFSAEFPLMGVTRRETGLSGYYRPVADGGFTFAVRVPEETDGARAALRVDGSPAACTVEEDGMVVFTVPGTAGQRIHWDIRY